MAARHQQPAASFDHLVGEREQFDRAGNSPSSKDKPVRADGIGVAEIPQMEFVINHHAE